MAEKLIYTLDRLIREARAARWTNIYLASPYTHAETRVRDRRHHDVIHVAAKMLRNDVIVFSPVAHFQPMTRIEPLPRTTTFWNRLNTTFLSRWADTLVVLMLPGWEESVGVEFEIALATRLDIPVVYLEEEEE